MREVLLIVIAFCSFVCVAADSNSVSPEKKQALRRAIDDLSLNYPAKYANGQEYAKRLDKISTSAEFSVLQREALLANPVLDFETLLVVKRGANNPGLPANWDSNSMLSRKPYDNEIAVLTIRDGSLKTLFRPTNNVFVGDVDLEYGADKMLFSMPKDNGRWHVWELRADGAGLRQITPDEEDIDQYDPCYLPDGRIIFASTAPFIGVPCVMGNSHIANLYLLSQDGKAVRQLCFDQENDWCPTVLNDGRVMYSRWEYSDLPHANSRRLFRMNPDGTDQRLYYGADSYFPPSFFYARPVPGHPSKIVGIVSGHHGVARAGRLLILDPAISRKDTGGVVQEIPGFGREVEMLVKDRIVDGVWPQFLHPYPLNEKYYIVSCKPGPHAQWGIYLVDIFDNMLKLYDAPGYCMFEPVPLIKKEKPQIVPDKVDLRSPAATVLVTDIYKGSGLPSIPHGTVKKLRIVGYYFSWWGMGGCLGTIGMDGPWDIKRVMGTVPVEDDGSAYFTVPAQMPVMVQPLDDKGQALQVMRSWFTGMPGEQMSCVGCHEKQNEAPPASPSSAAKREPSKIEPSWYGPTRGFNFAREVQPVLDRYCANCHSDPALAEEYQRYKPGDVHKPYLKGDRMINDWNSQISGNGGRLAGKFSMPYAELHRFVRRPGIEGDMRAFSPMDYHFSSSELGQMLEKGHHGVKLDGESLERLATWADLNAPYHGTWAEIAGAQRVMPMLHLAATARKKYAPSGPAFDFETIPELPKYDATPVAPRADGKTQIADIKLNGWPMSSEKATALQKDCAAKINKGELTKTIDLGNDVRVEMVLVPGGKFVMGSVTGHQDESPQTMIDLKPFWIGRFEISNQQFSQFDQLHDSRDESRHGYQFGQRGYSMDGTNQPAVRVSWLKVMAFCEWLSAKTGRKFTLPDEAQWEYACRAGSATSYSFGELGCDYSNAANLGDITLREFAACTWMDGRVHGASVLENASKYDDWIPRDNKYDDKGFVSQDIGKYKPNAWGLYDMHGNVWEWTLSAYKPYPYNAADGRNDIALKQKRVVRGGSWYDRPFKGTSSYRQAYEMYQPVFNVGFRVICSE